MLFGWRDFDSALLRANFSSGYFAGPYLRGQFRTQAIGSAYKNVLKYGREKRGRKNEPRDSRWIWRDLLERRLGRWRLFAAAETKSPSLGRSEVLPVALHEKSMYHPLRNPAVFAIQEVLLPPFDHSNALGPEPWAFFFCGP